MKKPPYTQILSPAERADCLVTGSMLKSAAEGVPADMVKTANLSGLADTGTKTVIALSLLTGIPLGIAGHLVHNSVRKQKIKERELLDKTDYYRDAADLVEDELAKNRITY